MKRFVPPGDGVKTVLQTVLAKMEQYVCLRRVIVTAFQVGKVIIAKYHVKKELMAISVVKNAAV